MIITKEEALRILKTGNKDEIAFALKVYFKNKLQSMKPIPVPNNEEINAAKKIFGVEN